MRPRLVGAAVVLAGLMTYQAVGFVLIAVALLLSSFVLWRQLDQERRIASLEAEQLRRAREQGQRLDDELRGD